MSLLETCKQHLPNLQWQEEQSICVGRIRNNPIAVKVSCIQEHISLKLGIVADEDAVIDLIYRHGKTKEIETLFENFRKDLHTFNTRLTEILTNF